MKITFPKWKQVCVLKNEKIKIAIKKLNFSALKIILVLDNKNKLLGVVNDGDLRRGLLRGINLAEPIFKIMNSKPFVAPPSMSKKTVQQIMRINRIFQVPIVDKKMRLIGLHLREDMEVKPRRENPFIIMAGGRGRRMMPFTETCPKPMLLVDGKPILEHIITRARDEGFHKFFICIHYLGQKIEKYFGDGQDLNVEINYIKEKTPLGTAGALSLFPGRILSPVLVTNGDVLTEVKYSELLAFHEKHQGFATMAVQLHHWEHPFGVVKMDGVEIQNIEEKPTSQAHVNAGIYVLSPNAIRSLPRDKITQMPDLFMRMKKKKKRLLAYPLHEPWLDVGRPEDLKNK